MAHKLKSLADKLDAEPQKRSQKRPVTKNGTIVFFKFNFQHIHYLLNSRGTNGVLNAIFPFWAKMKTVIAASCDDFSKNFRTRNQDHEF